MSQPRTLAVPASVLSLIETFLKVEDAWLYAHLKGWLAPPDAPPGHPWRTAVAVGRLFRAWEHPAPIRTEVVEALLAGIPHERTSFVIEWAQSLDARTVDDLTGYLCANADTLRVDFQALFPETDAPNWGDGTWQAELDRVRHRRDEMECVAAVLGHTVRKDTVRVILEDLDRDFGPAVRAVPSSMVLMGDKLLRRAGSLDPELWWSERRLPSDA